MPISDTIPDGRRGYRAAKLGSGHTLERFRCSVEKARCQPGTGAERDWRSVAVKVRSPVRDVGGASSKEEGMCEARMKEVTD